MTVGIVPTVNAQSGDSSEANDNPDASAARLQIELTQVEEQMRKLQGRIEEVAFENKQLRAQLEKTDGDTKFRLDALEKKQAPAPAPATSAAAAAASSKEEPAKPDSSQLQPVEPAPSEDPSGVEPSAKDAAPQKFPTPRDHYNYAFKLLNHTQYAQAGNAFASFTQQYPKDPLIGNAFYWLGETYYVRHDYVKAADNFRQGYESLPAGPKAADNLLKLAMSFNALNKDKEACVVLKQVVVKFGASSSSVKPRAEQEMNRIGCN